MASDSHTGTYSTTVQQGNGVQLKQLGSHISDTTYKTFVTSNGVGISTCGDSSLNNSPIASYIENFISSHPNESVIEMKDSILSYFRNIKPDLATIFILAGYIEEENLFHYHCYRVNIAANLIEDCSDAPAVWDGVRNVMSRLTSELYFKNDDGSYTKHSGNRILWEYFTLQDAIDFARYAVQATIDTMKFQETVKTVGGPVDVLVIRPTSFEWISRKELK